jgi:WD40 repeat protein
MFVLLVAVLTTAYAQRPDIIWEVPTPNSLANSIVGVGWSGNQVALGSTDRWLRSRVATTGGLIYSVLEPIRAGSVDQAIFSKDSQYLAVHNSGGGMDFRVHRASDGLFLGKLTVLISGNNIVHFAPDSQLSTTGGGTLTLWRISEFSVVLTVGSGYSKNTTTFNFSPDGIYQSAAIRGKITIQRRSDGSIIRVLNAGPPTGFTPAAFSPDSTSIAAWSSSPNRVTLWRIGDGTVLKAFPGAAPEEGVSAIRFTPNGDRLITTGYLPFLDSAGLWQQKGVIRFWRVSDGVLRNTYDLSTSLAVTSAVAWSPDASRFVYGTYDGSAVAALTPTP